MRNLNVSLTALIALGALALPAMGEIVTQPSGLTPGSTYQLLFVTSTTTTATSGDLNTYNNFVNAVVNSTPALASLGLTWHALAAAQNGYSARPTANVYTLNGTEVISASAVSTMIAVPTFEDGTLDNSGAFVWTGDGSNYIPYCSGQCGLGGTGNSAYGLPTSSNKWLLDNIAPDTNSYSLYAISSVITYSPTPEPGTVGLVLLGLGALGLARRRTTLTA